MMNDAESKERPHRLLAVDDNRLILRVIEDFFAPRGWAVAKAENVAAARAALAGTSPDVIVSDILMPDIDGWTFFEDVRRRKETESVPFVFLTVERELPQRLRGLNLGADDYMTKPFAVEELFVRVERLLERNASMKSARAMDGDALLAGSVEHLAISDLLQLLSLNGKDGIVQLTRGDEAGRIEFVGGRIVDAQAGSARGRKALFRILGWADASFRVLAREGKAPERTIGGATSIVLMDGVVALDEWARWVEVLPESDSRLALAEDTRVLTQGQPLRPVDYDVLARAKAGATVAEALEQSPYTDAAVAESICALLARGVIRATAVATKSKTASSH